jgi:hypothetical protein
MILQIVCALLAFVFKLFYLSLNGLFEWYYIGMALSLFIVLCVQLNGAKIRKVSTSKLGGDFQDSS